MQSTQQKREQIHEILGILISRGLSPWLRVPVVGHPNGLTVRDYVSQHTQLGDLEFSSPAANITNLSPEIQYEVKPLYAVRWWSSNLLWSLKRSVDNLINLGEGDTYANSRKSECY